MLDFARAIDNEAALMSISMGGYVTGRSAEKITGQAIGARMKKSSEAKG